MEFKVVVEKENLLFKRKEIEGLLQVETTPTKAQVITLLSEKYSVPEKNIAIDTIDGRFGSKEFIVVAQLYDSEEDKDATEIKTKKQRNAEKKAAQEAAKANAEISKSEVASQ